MPHRPLPHAFSSKIATKNLSISPSKFAIKIKNSPFPQFLKTLTMELFRNAKTVRFRSHHDKYLIADDDEEHVSQDRHASHRAALWTVEFPENATHDVIRLKSVYNRYLTASKEPYLLGATGRKVLQTLPRRLDSSVEWEPIRDGFQVKLKTRYGQFLRANGGLPPWRNSVTHDVPHRTSTQDWVLWDVEVVEVGPGGGGNGGKVSPPRPELEEGSPGSSERLSRTESSSSFPGSPPTPHKFDGRTVYYVIAEEDGSTDNSTELSFSFKGSSVGELTDALEEITQMDDEIVVCSRNPLNGMLCPLRLHLPPNNATMHVVVVRASSKVGKGFKKAENPV